MLALTAAAEVDGDIPVAFGGEAEDGEFGGGVPVGGGWGGRVVREAGTGHGVPEETAEPADGGGGDGEAGVDGHAVFAAEFAEAEGVVAVGFGARGGDGGAGVVEVEEVRGRGRGWRDVDDAVVVCVVR
jgi:hypothetical protein